MPWPWIFSGELVDPHGGQRDLEQRQLVFLNTDSVSDDPTRVIRRPATQLVWAWPQF